MGPNKVSAYFTGSVRFDQILKILSDFLIYLTALGALLRVETLQKLCEKSEEITRLTPPEIARRRLKNVEF